MSSALEDSNVANVLGAFAVHLADEVRSAIAGSEGDASGATALIHLVKYPGESIDGLRAPLGLTHSGCVRLVDRLEAAGLVERRAASDARAIALHLTRKGREASKAAQERRGEALLRAVHALAPQERQSLGRLVTKVLEATVPTVPAIQRACRACDYSACKECPFGAVG